MTYLELVNSVLRRLRESEVSAVTDNSYSKLIGEFVNDAKKQSEDAYNWNALTNTITVSATSTVSNYVLTGSGQRFRITEVINDTTNNFLQLQTTAQMSKLFLVGTTVAAEPMYYNFNGVDSNGDTKVDIYPIPDKTYSLQFNITKPQLSLSSNSDALLIPFEPVVLGATARAIAERGEDGGLASAEVYGLFKQSLADAIALESGRYLEESCWVDS